MLNTISDEVFEVFEDSSQHSPTPETALITHPRRSLADMAWGVEENGNGDVTDNQIWRSTLCLSLSLYTRNEDMMSMDGGFISESAALSEDSAFTPKVLTALLHLVHLMIGIWDVESTVWRESRV